MNIYFDFLARWDTADEIALTNDILTDGVTSVMSQVAGPQVLITLNAEEAKLGTATIGGAAATWMLSFDDTTDEWASWAVVIPESYNGSTLYAKGIYSMETDNSNDICMGIYIDYIDPAQDVDTEDYDTINCTSQTVPGTAGYPGEVIVTLTNDDSIVAGALARIKAERDSDGSCDTDDASDDLELRKIVIYTADYTWTQKTEYTNYFVNYGTGVTDSIIPITDESLNTWAINYAFE